jgi:uncharacterized protein YukE
MERRQLPRRLNGIQNALEHVENELCHAADEAREGKLNTNALHEKLMGLSSVVGALADQVQDAEDASRLTDEEELGQVLGMDFFPKLLSKGDGEEEKPQTEDQASQD